MKTRRFSAHRRLGILPRSALAMAGLLCMAQATSAAQSPMLQAPSQSVPNQSGPVPSGPTPQLSKPAAKKHGKHADPASDGVQPAFTIPVGPLGFAPPAQFYLGDRLSQVSLNFLDESTLLFTFRVPGLIAREPVTPGQTASSEIIQEERNIRALVLSLPGGKVTAEAVWRLHDFAPYLWMLHDHRFLLRDRNQLKSGDASLHLEPFLRFPGPVKYVELDPTERLLVAETVEAPAVESGQSDQDGIHATPDAQAEVAGPPSVIPGRGSDSHKHEPEHQSLLRILRMDDRKVLLFTRTDGGVVHLPLDGDGFYEASRGSGVNWNINYRDFSGAEDPVMQVASTCYPTLDVLSPGVVLASACTDVGGRKLIALTRDRRRLWEAAIPPTRVWPLLVRAADSPRMARASLDVSHPVAPTNPLDPEDIRGQTIQVYDVATGSVVLTGPASPVLDGGGGFALSPSGRRFAVLNDGAIQVFDLKAVPAVPSAAPSKSNPAQSKPAPSAPPAPIPDAPLPDAPNQTEPISSPPQANHYNLVVNLMAGRTLWPPPLCATQLPP
jgi:hypothetical protein